MFPTPFPLKCRPAWLALALLAASPVIAGEEPPLREILRDGLFAEEVSRDPEAAAKKYEQLLARYAEQRDIAASALFRLAEVRRKQDRKDDAIRLYQRLLSEFPQAENETKLARENLAALGGKPPEAGTVVPDKESEELARLQALAKTSPDVLHDPATLDNAVRSGFQKAVAFLLSSGADPFGGVALRLAAGSGNLAMVKQLLATRTPVPDAGGQAAVSEAVRFDRGAVLAFLLESGIRPDSRAVYDLLLNGKSAEAELLLKHGADPNAILPALNGTPPRLLLNELIYQDRFGAAKWLLEKGAKPGVAEPATGLTPLHFAAESGNDGSVALVEDLLKAGADPNAAASVFSSGGGTGRKRNPEEESQRDISPLLSAVRSNRKPLEKLRLLVDHGAKVGAYDGALLQEFVSRGDLEIAKLLIEAGADPKQSGLLVPFLDSANRSNVAKLRFLLENGADPNISVGTWKMDRTEFFNDPFLPATGKVEEYPATPLGQLRISKENPETALELIRLMLDAGAKAGLNLGSIVESVARIDEDGEIFRRLLAQRPENLDIRGFSDMEKWQPAPRRIYLDEVLIPKLSKLPGVTLLEADTGKRTTVAEGGGTKSLPKMVELLREKSDLILHRPSPNGAVSWPGLALVRVGNDARITRKTVDLEGSGPLPELQSGDVIESILGPQVTGGDEVREMLLRY